MSQVGVRQRSPVVRHVLAPLVAALSLLSSACTPPGAPALAAAGTQEAGDETRYSVYDLTSRWRDQNGASRTLASLRGRPQVIAMIYTHCAATCPLTVVDMKRIERATGGAAGFVLISLDPDHDTPARLAAFAREHDLSPERWTLLAGSDEDVRELAAVLGVRYRRVSPGELAHSNTLSVLDASGAVAMQAPALAGDDDIASAVRRLVR